MSDLTGLDRYDFDDPLGTTTKAAEGEWVHIDDLLPWLSAHAPSSDSELAPSAERGQAPRQGIPQDMYLKLKQAVDEYYNHHKSNPGGLGVAQAREMWAWLDDQQAAQPAPAPPAPDPTAEIPYDYLP